MWRLRGTLKRHNTSNKRKRWSLSSFWEKKTENPAVSGERCTKLMGCRKWAQYRHKLDKLNHPDIDCWATRMHPTKLQFPELSVASDYFTTCSLKQRHWRLELKLLQKAFRWTDTVLNKQPLAPCVRQPPTQFELQTESPHLCTFSRSLFCMWWSSED